MSPTLQRWDIVFERTDERDPSGHPGVILSSPAILGDPKQRRINVLLGSKKSPAVAALEHHAVLNGVNGLDHLTLVDCALVYQANKSAIIRIAGSVKDHWRTDIRRKVRACLGLG
jgi:hypothetical protein